MWSVDQNRKWQTHMFRKMSIRICTFHSQICVGIFHKVWTDQQLLQKLCSFYSKQHLINIHKIFYSQRIHRHQLITLPGLTRAVFSSCSFLHPVNQVMVRWLMWPLQSICLVCLKSLGLCFLWSIVYNTSEFILNAFVSSDITNKYNPLAAINADT